MLLLFSSIRQCICPTAALRPYPGDVSRSLMQFVLQMWISTITNIVYYIQVSIVRKMKYPILLRKICSFFLLFYRTTTVSQVIFFKNFARQRNEKRANHFFGIMLVMNTATLYIYVDDLQGAINIYTNSEVFSPIRFLFLQFSTLQIKTTSNI